MSKLMKKVEIDKKKSLNRKVNRTGFTQMEFIISLIIILLLIFTIYMFLADSSSGLKSLVVSIFG